MEANRGTPTFQSIHFQIMKKVEEKKTLLRSLPTQAVSKEKSIQYTWHGHHEVWENLTSETMTPLLPERVHLNEIILALWEDSSIYARVQLLRILRHARLLYGVWQAFKRIFKEAETRYDWEVYAILYNRMGYQESVPSQQNYAIITDEDQAQKFKEIKHLESWETRCAELTNKIDELENKETLASEDEVQLENLYEEFSNLESSPLNPGSYEPSVINWDNTRYLNGYSLDPSGKTRKYLTFCSTLQIVIAVKVLSEYDFL